MARVGLDVNRKFLRLAQGLNSVNAGFGALLARGALETLWSAAYERANDHLGDADDVELAAQWPGQRGVLAQLLLEAGGSGGLGFIEPDPDRGGYKLHALWEHAPPWVRRKATAQAAREAAGRTLSDVRREAGRKGRAVQLEGNGISVAWQPASLCLAKVSPGKGRVGKGKEEKEEKEKEEPAPRQRLRATPSALPNTAFDVLYASYPRHEGKSRGRTIFDREITTPERLAEVQRAIAGYLARLARDGTEPKFVKHFGTFMGCWRDYLDALPDAALGDQRGPQERELDEYLGARERARTGQASAVDLELITARERRRPAPEKSPP